MVLKNTILALCVDLNFHLNQNRNQAEPEPEPEPGPQNPNQDRTVIIEQEIILTPEQIIEERNIDINIDDN